MAKTLKAALCLLLCSTGVHASEPAAGTFHCFVKGNTNCGTTGCSVYEPVKTTFSYKAGASEFVRCVVYAGERNCFNVKGEFSHGTDPEPWLNVFDRKRGILFRINSTPSMTDNWFMYAAGAYLMTTNQEVGECLFSPDPAE